MTVLRRTPREVYRVYGEDEFLTRIAHHEQIEPATPAGAERRLQRVAGTTMLLAAAGAVGGLIALTSLTSVTGARRRIATGLLAATGSQRGLSRSSARVARARVWGGSADTDRSPRRGARELAASRVGAPHPASAATGAAIRRRTLAMIADERSAQVGAGAPAPSPPIQAAASTSAARATASASQPRGSGQSEFGFER